MTLRIKTLSITGFLQHCINDILHSDTRHNITECFYAECCFLVNAIMLNVVILNVMVPKIGICFLSGLCSGILWVYAFLHFMLI